MRQLIITIVAVLFLTNLLPAQEKIYLYKSGVVVGKYLTSEVDSIIFYATLPVVSTSSVADISIYSAKCGGNVSSDGGEEVTERGVCWNSTGNPVYSDSKTSNGIGTGSFESTLSRLAAGQTYYVRSYAKNSVGVAYGNQQVFTTLSSVPPTFSSGMDITVSSNSAKVTITISSDGGGTITAKGVVWSATNSTPDLNNKDGFTNDGTGSAVFSSMLTNLLPNTKYYVRAYATNNAGTSYSNVFSFTTSDNKVVDGEGNEYTTVTIGNQTWMGQNLRVTKFNNGDAITNSWDYNNNTTYRKDYGRLYSWSATTDSRLVCPSGWHVPSSVEWDELINYLAGNGYADPGLLAKALCSKSGWASSTVPNTPGYQPESNNATGFSALPAGMRAIWGESIYLDYATWWWTSDEWIDNPNYGAYRTISNGQGSVIPYVEEKNAGLSVRCVKDEGNGTEPTKSKPTVTTESSGSITATSAIINGNVSSDGGATITQRGFYMSSTSSSPDQSSTVVNVDGQTGNFSKTLSGLTENTTYYYRAFATNSVGTNTGDVKSFKTVSSGSGGETATTFTDARDGHIYKKVVIGTQTWMAENLAYLPTVNSSTDRFYGLPAFYVYGYNGSNVEAAKATSNYKTYGVMYNWYAVMDGSSSSTSVPSGVKGVCPAGWHLPSYDEMYVLINYVGGDLVAGKKLKTVGTSMWAEPNAGATNEYGFSAIPGGGYSDAYNFDLIGKYSFWWSATEKSADYAYEFQMGYDLTEFWRYSNPKTNGDYVRCVKDK